MRRYEWGFPRTLQECLDVYSAEAHAAKGRRQPKADKRRRLWADSGHSPQSGRRPELQTQPPLPFRVFADAASACRCGTLIAALQPMSPDRSFKTSLRREFQTALSLQPGRAIETRTFLPFAHATEISVDHGTLAACVSPHGYVLFSIEGLGQVILSATSDQRDHSSGAVHTFVCPNHVANRRSKEEKFTRGSHSG